MWQWHIKLKIHRAIENLLNRTSSIVELEILLGTHLFGSASYNFFQSFQSRVPDKLVFGKAIQQIKKKKYNTRWLQFVFAKLFTVF